MAEKRKDEGARDPIKIFQEEALKKQRNAMMDNFAQILQWMPTSSTSTSNSHSRGTPPFNVHVKFKILVFEGHIDANTIDKWLNFLEGYFLVHDFYD